MKNEETVHGMTGKQNAKKADDQKASSHLHIRITTEEKAAIRSTSNYIAKFCN
jgi:hypothetical protein